MTPGGAAAMVRRVTVTVVVLLAAGAFARRAAAQDPANEAQIKAAFVYNFLKFVDWPAAAFTRPDESLVIAIVGEGKTADAVEQLLSAKQVGERKLVVRHLRWDQQATGMHAVFVSEDDPKRIRRATEAAAVAGALSIGESEKFTESGGVIGLVIEGRRVRFDIDVDAASAARLRISSKLLALGRTIHSTKALSGESP